MKNGIKKHIEKRQKKEYILSEIKFTLQLGAVIFTPIIGAFIYWIKWDYVL